MEFPQNICDRSWRGFVKGSAFSLLSTRFVFQALFAAEPLPDKSHFTLFNPTPTPLLRPLSPDRPDKTESPYTVDAGHVQLEMDFANLGETRRSTPEGSLRSRTYEIAPLTLKLGLLNNVDLQAAIVPFSETRERLDGRRSTTSTSFEDITPRLKINLFGNDSGDVAMGLIPYVTLPTKHREDGQETVGGGAALPVSFSIGDWDFGIQTAWSLQRIKGSRVAHGEFENSLTTSHALFGKLSAAAEFYSSVSTESGAGWIGTVNTWLTLEVTENLMLDAGVFIGITRAAEDFHPWIGMTVRY